MGRLDDGGELVIGVEEAKALTEPVATKNEQKRAASLEKSAERAVRIADREIRRAAKAGSSEVTLDVEKMCPWWRPCYYREEEYIKNALVENLLAQGFSVQTYGQGTTLVRVSW